MTLALDIGGTNIRIAEVSKTKIKNYKKVKTPKKRKEFLSTITELISQFPKQKTICICLPGFERDGKTYNNMDADFNNIPLRKILKQKFKSKVYIENDADCAGLAELHHGFGKPHKDFVLLTLGTGIGGAIIINKKLYKGSGLAGEIDGMCINKENFEDLASGDASLEIAKKHGFKNISSLKLEELANKGNKKAKAVYKKVGNSLGIGLANLTFILSPEVFILGGGFSRVKHIYPQMNKTFKEKYWLSPKPKIIKAKFGDDAGLIGAALLPKVS
jgi:predicted NBD/HSP70 family sugar kinase